jgi:UDP-N-acetylmuramoylalanine--D-glutamate ligase
MNLFLERCSARTIGITGSVGKSTTTALIHEALRAALGPSSVFLGGNIGRSLLFDLPAMRAQDFVVLELSSFMLEETPQIRWSPHIAVVTNIFPNHLDRHGTMAAYRAAKQNILRFQTSDDIAVLNKDHELVAPWVQLARGKSVTFTAGNPAAHMDLAMPGAHNQSNAAAALAVLDCLQVPLDRAAALHALCQFPGLAHRLQCVHALEHPGMPARRLRFFNDSKATSPDASATAIEAFAPRCAIFIIGGYDKHLPPEAFDNFDHLMAQRALAVIGIGQTGQEMIGRIQALAGGAAALRARYAETLDRAVPLARAWAGELGAEAVVLSPASASWDQFANYEKRGDLFGELARQLS